jgi:dTDP-glucose pyrophosphorylase
MTDEWLRACIAPDVPIRTALATLNQAHLQILLVLDSSKKLLGVVTDGDVRRAILADKDFSLPISSIMTSAPITAEPGLDAHELTQLMVRNSIHAVPVVQDDGTLIGLRTWADTTLPAATAHSHKDCPVVIMAGGKGTRLDPFTRILPKPLIPLGDKPIVERIMDHFSEYGFSDFRMIVNYKGDIIRSYFAEGRRPYSITFVQEPAFLGTAGGLQLMQQELSGTFLVANCDIVVDTDLDAFYRFHVEHGNDATVLGVLRYSTIPYGVLKNDGYRLLDMEEKPEMRFVINSGVYALRASMLSYLSDGEPMDMPDLLNKASEDGRRVEVFPVNAGWFDIGRWDEYERVSGFVSSAEAPTKEKDQDD